MNALQAGRLHRLIAEATHPKTCPITGEKYTADELSELGEASARIVGYEHGDSTVGELMEVRLSLPGIGLRERELFLDAAGGLWVWSTVRIPAGECPCSCDDGDEVFGGPARCPRHGDGVREVEVYRAVVAIGWELVLQTLSRLIPGKVPSWAFVVREGEPMRDVLVEYRAELAKAAA